MQRKILILASVWPSRASTAAATRLLDLIQALQKAEYAIVVSADEKESDAVLHLQSQKIPCVRLAPNDAAFDRFLSDFQPDVVLFDRYATEEKFAWRVRAVCPDALRILDTIDLHFLRLAREKAARLGSLETTPWSQILALAGDSLHRELAAIHRSDLSLVVSDAEAKILVEKCAVAPAQILLCRLTYPPPLQNPPAFAERKGYAMIGNFRHAPNADAVHWLKNEIWPLIKELQPDAEVRIYGSYAQPKHTALSAPKQGFFVEGFAPDAMQVMKTCRVNLAPLRFGAGIKGKVADGWACGTPVITTAVGAEGMHGNLPFAGIVASDAASIAAAAVGLYHDERNWKLHAEQAQKLIHELYAAEVTSQVFLRSIDDLFQNREAARIANVTGHILWQQAFRSTEYFSRWIEAKNAKVQSLVD